MPLIVATLLGTVVAHAASLGGITARSLAAINQSASVPAPAVLGCDNFTGTNGASISGRAAVSAAACSARVWTVHVGTWFIQANRGESSSTASAVATQATSVVDSSAMVLLMNLNAGGRFGGVVLSHDGTSTYLAAVMTDGAPDRIELLLVTSGAPTVLATVNPTFATMNTLMLTRSGASITVNLNAAVVLVFGLTAGQLSTLGSGSRSGLFGGSATVRFDDFLVSAP